MCSSSCVSGGGGERVSCSAEVDAPSAPVETSASLPIEEEHVETSSIVAAPTAAPDNPDPGVTAPALDGCTDTGDEAFTTTDISPEGRHILNG